MRSLRRRVMEGVDLFPPYIKTSGKQLIQTDWIPVVDTKVQVCLHLKDCRQMNDLEGTWFCQPNDNFIFTVNNGSQDWQWNQLYQWNNKPYSSGGGICVVDCAAYYSSTVPLYYSMETTKSTYYSKGEYQNCYLDKRNGYSDNAIILFGSRDRPYNRATMYIYGVKCWNNGVLERDFVPARKNGVYGLYDKIQHKFWRSSTEVDFRGPND